MSKRFFYANFVDLQIYHSWDTCMISLCLHCRKSFFIIMYRVSMETVKFISPKCVCSCIWFLINMTIFFKSKMYALVVILGLAKWATVKCV